MASPSPDRHDDGYATVAAATMALALGIVATAVVGVGVADLRLARADARATKVELGLAGAQVAAVGALLTRASAPRLRWRASSDLGTVTVLAEAEARKLSLGSAAALDDDALGRLGVTDAEGLRRRLRAIAQTKGAPALSLDALDSGPLWRACASMLISPYGRGRTLQAAAPVEPQPTQAPSPPGSVWRMRVSGPSGWSEDRIVRLTGDEHRPAAVLERRLSKTSSGGEPCAAVIE